VVTLGLLSGRKHAIECALRRVLGWRRTQLPRANERAAARRHCPGVPEVDAAEMARAWEEKRWDIELFGRARHAEASILRRVGCMARHLAPTGVDDDWESALASSAVGRNGTARGSVKPYAMKGSRVATTMLQFVCLSRSLREGVEDVKCRAL